ncbi:DUF1642 domain-containing protein [Enterococcus durans]|uniref:DUF1642 domain-containing protein n=1 Tax=Enterococcus durans TaxID=53345 RepID=UPI0039A6103B
MDKQEVIERLNNKLDEVFAFQRSFEPLTGAYMECESKASAYMIAINYVEQLDEPQKVKVPAFVAEWYEMNKKNLEYRIWNYIQTWNDQGWNDFKNWMNKSSIKSLEILIKMQDGYEVEEEPLYYVRLPYEVWDEEAAELKTEYLYLHYEITSDETRIFPTKEPRKGFVAKLDELTIKSADERYWPFAVPVEEVAER